MTPRFFNVFAVAVAAVFAPMTALADCGENCSLSCSGYSDPQEWDACMYPCLQSCLGSEEWVPEVPAPEPVPEEESRLDDGAQWEQAALPECVDEGYACVLNGTPCCGVNTCKGTFPNTTCQP